MLFVGIGNGLRIGQTRMLSVRAVWVYRAPLTVRHVEISLGESSNAQSTLKCDGSFAIAKRTRDVLRSVNRAGWRCRLHADVRTLLLRYRSMVAHKVRLKATEISKCL